jgi:hypothetical protein
LLQALVDSSAELVFVLVGLQRSGTEVHCFCVAVRRSEAGQSFAGAGDAAALNQPCSWWLDCLFRSASGAVLSEHCGFNCGAASSFGEKNASKNAGNRLVRPDWV